MTATCGASELATLLGLGREHEDGEPWTSPGSVWARLVGLSNRYDADTSPDCEIGRDTEIAVGHRFARENKLTPGVDVFAGPTLEQDPYTHPDLPWLHARPDLLVTSGLRGPVELKSPRDLDAERWGDSGTDQMPADYFVQLVVQVAICHRLGLGDHGRLAAMARAPRKNRRVWVQYEWPRDIAMEDTVLEAGERWYDRHVRGATPPGADGTASYSEALARMWSRPGDRVVDAEPDVREDVRRLVQVTTAAKEQAKHIRTLRQRIQLAMREGTVLRIDGDTAVTWRADVHGRRRFCVRTRDGHLEEDST